MGVTFQEMGALLAKKTSEFLENSRLHSHGFTGLSGSEISPDLAPRYQLTGEGAVVGHHYKISLRAFKIFLGTLYSLKYLRNVWILKNEIIFFYFIYGILSGRLHLKAYLPANTYTLYKQS